ncbi:hypothetical protein OG787_12235 [Streptomyces sp. NBC_00075]|uniref:hypothetical protein n=1 Tax=Streptomyces sp. NBC_00075 TaxID=2975641 RepID=UPI003252A7F5
MSEVEQVRAALAAARAQQEEAAARRVRAAGELRRAQEAITAAERGGDREAAAAAAERGEDARRLLTEASDAVRRARESVRAAQELSQPVTDPRDLIARLSAAVPALLFPMRLETRFRELSAEGEAEPPGVRHQLWVRAFPDTCSIDTFTAELTASEAASARTYWAETWAAGGEEAGERAAWRALAASHGSGRAHWITDSHRPANEEDRPARTTPGEVILALAVPTAPPAAELAALTAYWTAWWRAGTDTAAQRAARTALEGAVGAARAAEIVARPPAGLAAEPVPPATHATAPVTVAVAVLPDPPAAAATGWSRAPRAALLPDRLVLVAESGDQRTQILGRPLPPAVFTGPDPLAPAEEQLQQADGQLAFPDELAWLTDFERAVADGLGFVVDLSPEQARTGFDRLYVLGLRTLTEPEDNAADLEDLLRHHHYGQAGLALVPQGAPTNNTEAVGMGFARADDPDVAFDARRAGPLGHEPNPALRGDGQCLAGLLGIVPATLDAVPHAHGRDQREARAMQTLLWPATLGYLLGTLLEPVLDENTVENTRWFFTRHVRGRGALPAVRIGAQPYGVLATTAFSRSSWLWPGPRPSSTPRTTFLVQLHELLREAARDWDALVDQVPSLGRGGARTDDDAHQTLLGILGLHPTSAEFHYRYAEGRIQLVNKAHVSGYGDLLHQAWAAAGLDDPALALLRRLGYQGTERVPLLDLYFHGRQTPLKGPLVDDRPLSEAAPVRPWTTDGRNYLRWLHDAATTSLDLLRSDGAFEAGAPTALLFLLARHALTLGYEEAGRTLHLLAGHDVATVRAMRREPPFVHVAERGPSESRFAPLYRHDPLISPGQDWTVAAHIADVLRHSRGTHVLREQVEALDLLADVPTARLERALVEHLDTAAYRLDAWQLGLVNLQLERMRARGREEEGQEARGIHIGAYGWLEDVRPGGRALTPVQLPQDLMEVFGDGPPLRHDPGNGGHMLAPSLNQAVTASVLRSAYLSDASPEDPGAMAVNLSSARVRRAVEVLDGMRAGQSLGALLGYTLERGLHDRSGFAEVDVFIYALRRAFPLRADRLRSTATGPGEPIEAVEARNVVDGLALVEHIERTGATTYPFGLAPGRLPNAQPAQRKALEDEVDALRDLRDALGDLALAEAVHQASQGGTERAAATLRTFETGHQPPEPEVVRTPASGTTLTHRMGLHLDPAAAAPSGATPRALAVPALDAWLSATLPPLGSIGCRVGWDDPADGTPRALPVTLADLGLRPVDVLELLRGEEQAMAELDDRVLRHVLRTAAPRPDAPLHIAYRECEPGQIPVFEVAALTAHLRALVSAARPLRPSDVVLPGEAGTDLDSTAVLDPAPLTGIETLLTQLSADIAAYLGVWEPLLEDPAAGRAALLAGTDTAVDDAVELLERAARLVVPGVGWGQALLSRQAQYAQTVARLRGRADQWSTRLTEADTRLAAYDLLPAGTPDAEQMAELAAIEALVVVTPAAPAPAPVTRRSDVGALRDGFAARRDALTAITGGAEPGLSALRTAVLAVLPFTAVDSEPFETESIEQAMIALVSDVVTIVGSLAAELARRTEAAQDAFAAHAAAADAPARVEALQTCAQALLGEETRLIPHFTMRPAAAAEWSRALAAVPDLLSHLTGALHADFPVEDWLHSAARVRTPLWRFEQAGLLAEALGAPVPEPVPVQLPHRPGDRWLAMEYPPEQDLGGEHLLYTAVYPVPFDPAGTLCGLLLDEWTEVLPSDETTAGLAFHYDRPSSEAPQALLLVTPASGGRTWTWDDLRQSVPDTMALAKRRAVEPVHLGAGPAARFLPAAVSAVTLRGISISLALAAGNGAFDQLGGQT